MLKVRAEHRETGEYVEICTGNRAVTYDKNYIEMLIREAAFHYAIPLDYFDIKYRNDTDDDWVFMQQAR